jgi:hypothetical protein
MHMVKQLCITVDIGSKTKLFSRLCNAGSTSGGAAGQSVVSLLRLGLYSGHGSVRVVAECLARPTFSHAIPYVTGPSHYM